MTPLHELCVVDHPEGAEVVLVPHEALVQRQVRADRVLDCDESNLYDGGFFWRTKMIEGRKKR